MSIVCEVEPDPREGARSAGSTGDERVPRRSSKRCKRFDFQKSAICCGFLKVRLRKHPHGMFSPLRMTRGVLRFFRLFRSSIRPCFIFQYRKGAELLVRLLVYQSFLSSARMSLSRSSVVGFASRSAFAAASAAAASAAACSAALRAFSAK